MVVDGTGIVEGMADWMTGALGQDRVTSFRFTAPSKAQLGASFNSVFETGRFAN